MGKTGISDFMGMQEENNGVQEKET